MPIGPGDGCCECFRAITFPLVFGPERPPRFGQAGAIRLIVPLEICKSELADVASRCLLLEGPIPSGFTNVLGILKVVNVYSQATVGTDRTFSQTIIASSPSLVSVLDAAGHVILLGYLDPTLPTQVIDALSTAVALVYFAFDFQAFPEANRQQLLSLLTENAATVTLGFQRSDMRAS